MAADYTIRASGGDYTTLSAWEADVATQVGSSNLVTASAGRQRALLYNDWASGLSDNVTVAGYTADATNYMEIAAAAGSGTQGANSHGGTTGTGARIETTHTDAVVVLSVAYTRLTGVGVTNTRATTLNYPGVYANAANVTISDVWVKAAGAATYGGVGLNAASATLNNVLLDRIDGPGIRIGNAGFALNHVVAVGCSGVGFDAISVNNPVAKLCCAYGNTGNGFNGTFGAASAYNASDDGTAPNTNEVSLTGDPFTNSAGGDYTHGAASELTDAGGTTGAGVSTDCIGTARPQATYYDIGWFEYVAAGGTTAVPVFAHHYQQQMRVACS